MFVSEYGKSYATEEEYNLRYEMFKVNIKQIEAHDSEIEGFEVRLNEMSDWTDDEYAMISGQAHTKTRMEKRVGTGEKRLPESNLKTNVDWNKDGFVGPARS